MVRTLVVGLMYGTVLGSAAATPAAARAADPASVPAPDLKAGDAWVFDRTIERGTNGFRDQRLDIRIERVGPQTMVIGIKPDGSPLDYEDQVVGRDWSHHRIVDGVQTTTGRPLSFPLSIGETWTADYVDPTHYGLQTSAHHHETYKVTGWEDVTTPAGTFHALKIESDDHVEGQFMGASGAVGGSYTTADGATSVAHSGVSAPHTAYAEFFSTFYYAPTVKYWVKSVEEDFDSENVRTRRQTDVLISFKPAS